MDIEGIKNGDILVINYHPKPNYYWDFSRKYIIFIASGNKIVSHSNGEWVSIPTVAHIDLVGEFSRNGSVGFTIKPDSTECESELSKPTMSQYVELMEAIATNKYTYNIKTKQLKKKRSK